MSRTWHHACGVVEPVAGCKETEGLMKPIAKWALLLIPTLALATPASAFPPAGLSDSGQPGSVIVYPKFVNSLFGGGSLLNVDGNLVSQTEGRGSNPSPWYHHKSAVNKQVRTVRRGDGRHQFASFGPTV
jgi:hypothetical protein